MTKNKVQKNRIPDGWEIKKLGEVCTVNQGLQIPISERFKEYKKGREKYITNQFLAGKSEIEYIENFTQSVVCGKKDILMTRTGNTGIVVHGVSGVFHNNFFKVARDKNLIESGYFVYFLKMPHTQHRLIHLAGSSTIPDLNHSDFFSIKINLPPLLEQKRIVGVLEVWDEGVEKLERKIEIKEDIKKGLMQQLLTGKKRLPGFSGEWKEKILGKLGKTYPGLKGKTKKDFTNDRKKGKQFIPYMNIYSNSKININNIDTFVKLKDNENQNSAKYGDLFFTTSSETPDEVGISSVLLDKNIDDTYLNSFCFGFRLNNFDVLLPEFSQFYFRGQNFRKKMFRVAQGASRFNLSKKYFLDTIIKIPKDSKEQKAIAEVLTTADEEIKMLRRKLEILKDQKKFLLNNLITGQIRV